MEEDITKLKKAMEEAVQRVKKILPEVSSLSEEDAKKIIGRYTAAIQGNFVPWMSAAIVSARSVQGRFAAEENLFVEIRDDHPGMLHNFAESADALPSREDYDKVYGEVKNIGKIASQMSCLKTLTLMATLENTAGAFIPFLADLAKKLGSKNLIYTNVHGEADIGHADQFVWALSHESKYYENPEQIIHSTVESTINLLNKIFTV